MPGITCLSAMILFVNLHESVTWQWVSSEIASSRCSVLLRIWRYFLPVRTGSPCICGVVMTLIILALTPCLLCPWKVDFFLFYLPLTHYARCIWRYYFASFVNIMQDENALCPFSEILQVTSWGEKRFDSSFINIVLKCSWHKRLTGKLNTCDESCTTHGRDNKFLKKC